MQSNPAPPNGDQHGDSQRYIGVTSAVASLLSLLLLSGTLVMWARSYLHVDSWLVDGMVEATNPPVAWVSPVSGKMARPEFAASPLNLQKQPTWHSESGWLSIPPYSLWFVPGFASSQNTQVRQLGTVADVHGHLAAIGSVAVPYSAAAGIAAVLPAVWMWRFHRTRFPGESVQYGVRMLMLGMTAACIAMFGYREVGPASILRMVNVAVAAVPAYALARWSARPEVASLRTPLRLGSILLFLWTFVASIHFVNQLIYQRAFTEAWCD